MTIERLLLSLFLLAGGLLIAALTFMGTGIGGEGADLGPGRTNLESWLQVPGWSPGAIKSAGQDGAAGLSGLIGAIEPRVTFAGLAVGWTLRWVYSLPWSAIPRAVVVWMLGWRNSVAMLGLAAGCIAVILLF